MSTIFFSVGASLDGFIAGLNGGPTNPLGDRGTTIHEWMYQTAAFRQHLGIGSDGETGPDNDILLHVINRTGANIMGKNMFDEGESNWPEDAPFHSPVYVLTHEKREPWERKGGTTFFFVNDGIESALEQARLAAGEKDIRIAGGANIIQQFLRAGLVDEFTIHLSPVILGQGVRLFKDTSPESTVEIMDITASPIVSHMQYKIKK